VKIYLASRFSRGHELRTYRDELRQIGLTVTSRWLGGHGLDDANAVYTDETLATFALEDLEDIEASDVLIAFTERRTVGYMSGGRHVEAGYALALRIPIIVVGPAENIFYQMGVTERSDVTVVPDWHMALAHLLGRSVRNLEAVVPV
jgi:nucleoside 2-deoxyribosyltransferase